MHCRPPGQRHRKNIWFFEAGNRFVLPEMRKSAGRRILQHLDLLHRQKFNIQHHARPQDLGQRLLHAKDRGMSGDVILPAWPESSLSPALPLKTLQN